MTSLEKLYEPRENRPSPPSSEIVAQGERARGKLYHFLQKERGQMTREEYQQRLQELGDLTPTQAHYKYMAKTRDYPNLASFHGREEELAEIIGR